MRVAPSKSQLLLDTGNLKILSLKSAAAGNGVPSACPEVQRDVNHEGIRSPLCVPLKKNTKKYELGTPDTQKNQHTHRTGAVGP